MGGKIQRYVYGREDPKLCVWKEKFKDACMRREIQRGVYGREDTKMRVWVGKPKDVWMGRGILGEEIQRGMCRSEDLKLCISEVHE